MKRLFAVCLCVGLLVRVGFAVVIPVNCNLFFNGSNAVQIAWNAYPGESYVIQTTANLAQPWQSGAALTTTSNAIYQSFPVTGTAQFFKVVKLDTDGPEVYKTVPFDGAIGVNPQATIQAWLRDDSGVNTNTIALTVGTNAPVSLKDSRLSYVDGLLTYTPGTNEFFGTNGQIITLGLTVADTLGNQTTNFTWSFQLALSPVISTNIVFLGGTNPAPCNLTLLSTNGDYFTFSYTGSCCLTNGMQLVNTNLYTGYARTVVSFTNYPASNTVVALTRTATLAELLQVGTLSSSGFIPLTNSAGGAIQPKDLTTTLDFPLNYTVPLGRVLSPAGNLLVQILPSSQLNLNATLHLVANFQQGLTAVQAQVNGTASFELDVQAQAAASGGFAGSLPLITPIHERYFRFIGPLLVWVDVEFEVNAGYTANFSGSAEITDGINAVKTISVGRKWDAVKGWADIFNNPPASLNILAPVWQIQGSADVRAYLQPKVSVLIYSTAGFSADLQPYLDLSGSAQLSPPQCDLSLFAGLNSTIAMDLSVWDSHWGALPSTTLNLIPQQTLWNYSCAPNAPQITVQPQSQTVSADSTVSFSVEAQGSAPLRYCWYKNGLYLTDDTRITGSAASTLGIANVQTSDAGTYMVRVSNPVASTNSANAVLTVSTGMVLIPAGSFTMGDTTGDYSNDIPTVTYVSAFYMDANLVSYSQWQSVYSWATSHGYGFDHPGSGKASTHPVQTIDWYNCVKWCNARSEMEGKIPAYYTDSGLSVPYRSGQVAPYVNWSAGYRLPTEAEWEKAARGGASGQRFPWGNTISESQANYGGCISGCGWSYDLGPNGLNALFDTGAYPYTSPVGYFAPNSYGLYDMAGNVFEWCWDWYGVGVPYAGGTDPRGPASGSFRVLRGGAWDDGAYYCRTAYRDFLDPWDYDDDDVGFRSVLPSDQ